MTFSISSSYSKLRSLVDASDDSTLPSPDALIDSANALPLVLPDSGLGEQAISEHLLNVVVPGLNGQKTSPNYYGFVIGGVLPIAEFADNIVTAYDQNVMMHLPDQTLATVVEGRALDFLVELLDLGQGKEWGGRTFTTGATGANILGLACGREMAVQKRLRQGVSVGELGLLRACMEAGVKEIQVLTSMGHSSLYKAASVVGIGRASVKDVGCKDGQPWKLDLASLETELQREKEGVVSIVVVSAGEVNTGRFATNGMEIMGKARELCDQYGAWLHVDGAFGLFARSLPKTPEFTSLLTATAGLHLADSITGDCHKMLNVPYDCGFFLARASHPLSSTFQNAHASYLSSSTTITPSPLNIGLENSRRFRALPVYAVLLAHGRQGFSEMFAQQVRLARAVAEFIRECEGLELVLDREGEGSGVEDIFMVVIFRAKKEEVTEGLVGRINRTRRMYVSGTRWEGKAAVRIAVSTWMVDVERDLEVVKGVLKDVLVE